TFQPSAELKLRFYAYFKQATIGRCNEPKPAFWDVVKRAKWLTNSVEFKFKIFLALMHLTGTPGML
uniref:ACB domain-containing protein n=1 Tax=Romanomermis culicivorax TaxID=13658 RepID=A0A915IVL4_ROMCU